MTRKLLLGTGLRVAGLALRHDLRAQAQQQTTDLEGRLADIDQPLKGSKRLLWSEAPP